MVGVWLRGRRAHGRSRSRVAAVASRVALSRHCFVRAALLLAKPETGVLRDSSSNGHEIRELGEHSGVTRKKTVCLMAAATSKKVAVFGLIVDDSESPSP